MNDMVTWLTQLELLVITLAQDMVASEIAVIFLVWNALLGGSVVQSQGLQRGFYDSICPDAEDIVRSTVEKYYNNDATIAPGLLRLHFHDCFVQVSFINALISITSCLGTHVATRIPCYFLHSTLQKMEMHTTYNKPLGMKGPQVLLLLCLTYVSARMIYRDVMLLFWFLEHHLKGLPHRILVLGDLKW